jgi:hypothetical protein
LSRIEGRVTGVQAHRSLAHLLVVLTIGGTALACVRLTGAHDGCVVSSDCDPGRSCVAGVCEPLRSDDAAKDSAPDAKSEVAIDMAADGILAAPPARDGGVDLPADIDSGDSGSAGSEVPPEAGSGDAAADLVADGAAPPSLCGVVVDAEASPLNPSAAPDLTGTWRLCSSGADLPPDIRWLLGDASTIQLDSTYFWRLASGQTSHDAQAASGMYFEILEGARTVVQFVDSDVGAGGGAMVAIGLFPASGALQLASCDGAAGCGAPVARLSLVSSAGSEQ